MITIETIVMLTAGCAILVAIATWLILKYQLHKDEETPLKTLKRSVQKERKKKRGR